MSLNTEQQKNKAESLKALRQKRNNATFPGTNDGEKSELMPSNTQGRMHPPAQSRDATAPSRFQVLTPRSSSSILAPNSSPVNLNNGTYHGIDISHISKHNLSADTVIGTPEFRAKWQFSGASRNPDTLATTSLFTRQNHSQQQAHSSTDTGTAGSFQTQSTPSSLSVTGSLVPESPSVQRPGKRRRVTIDSSEDEVSNPNSSMIVGPSRIVRGTRSSETTPPASLNHEGLTKLRKLSIVNPEIDFAQVKQIFYLCSGDVVEAQRLIDKIRTGVAHLSLPSGAPSPSKPSSSAQANNKMEQERRLKREEERLRSKHSSIYANRNKLNTTDGGSSQDVIVIPTSSPILAPPSVRKKMVRVVNSESDYEEGSDDNSVELIEARSRSHYEEQALKWFNESSIGALQELSGCTKAQAEAIVDKRPFDNVANLKLKLGQGSKRKTGPAGLSPNSFSECVEILKNYGVVDDVLERCEKIGEDINRILSRWSAKRTASVESSVSEPGALGLSELDQISTDGFLRSQPGTLSKGVTLKEYQLVGLNWLDLLYTKKRSCILADEMGLGKTVQVISFVALLKEKGIRGPHLIVVPSSTLENWTREFERFAPTISCQTYYGNKDERRELRHQLKSQATHSSGWEVLITTYNLAQGDEQDRKFFYKRSWDTCIFDEGHVLKNFQSQRYTSLVKIPSKWRLLLTGTPLQNNLEELVSLMNFILPNLFIDVVEELRRIFKSKADSTAAFLSRDRISRAKRMMTPFVLRRRKDQVLKELPRKVERVEYCEMTTLQRRIYNEALRRSRSLATNTPLGPLNSVEADPGRSSKNSRKSNLPMTKDSSANVLMDLRKAASHPMLFRRKFTDDTLSGIARVLLRLPDFVKRRAEFELVKEDMEVMTDSELQFLCQQHKTTEKFALDPKCFEDAGKVTVLLKLLGVYLREGRRILIFSQFTQILDILQTVLRNHSIRYLTLTGSTPVDVRQALVDEFTEDESIGVFLLSTKAGGMGINLTAASVVIIFDQDYNPHNDKQASDRAYRIGQTRDVDVIKLVTKGTIEEHMLRLGRTKLALDEAVAGEKGDEKSEEVMKASLMSTLRQEYVEPSDDLPSNDIVNDE